MAYHERRLPKPSRASIEIDGEAYDIDVIGQDDGRDPDPDASFRLLLQLGQGLMIYVYVIGMARPDDPRAFHSLWLKDCAAAWVDEEEYGPPSRVAAGPIELPIAFARVELLGPRERSSFAIVGLRFESRPTGQPNAPDLELCWQLRDDAHERVDLVYASASGWTLVRSGWVRALERDERIVFGDPQSS